MYFNNTSCDLYIGTGAGKKLMEELAQAKSSIKIVSPYVSAQLASGLAALHQQGVAVQLITCENDSYSELLQTLVRQEVHIDSTACKWRNRLNAGSWMVSVILFISLLVVVWSFSRQQISWLMSGSVVLLASVLIMVILRYLKKRIRVKTYSYSSIFPIKVLRQRNEYGRRATFLHSKIYIIDDQIAYLGSLNFTRSGTETNYETRIRITDPSALAKILEEFNYLLNENDCPKLDIQYWGSLHFREPLN